MVRDTGQFVAKYLKNLIMRQLTGLNDAVGKPRLPKKGGNAPIGVYWIRRTWERARVEATGEGTSPLRIDAAPI